MEIQTALEIVHKMATQLYERHGEFTPPATCPADAEEALEAVDVFIDTNYDREDLLEY